MLDDKIREPLTVWLNACVEVFRARCTSIEDVVKDSFRRGYVDGYYAKQEEYPNLHYNLSDVIERKEYMGPVIFLPIPVYMDNPGDVKLLDENELPEMIKCVNAVYAYYRNTESGTFIYKFVGAKV